MIVELGRGGDEREYSMAAEMLKDLGVTKITLLTNNLDKVKGLEENGIKVVERVSLQPKDWEQESGNQATDTGISLQTRSIMRERDDYLKTKRDKMGHVLDIPKYLDSSEARLGISHEIRKIQVLNGFYPNLDKGIESHDSSHLNEN